MGSLSSGIAASVFTVLASLLMPLQVKAQPVCTWRGDVPSPQIASLQQQAESYLRTVTVADLAITIVSADQTFYLLCAAQEPVRITENTRFEVGSLSKVFTSLILAQAVTDNRVALDDDIRKYLPEAFANLAFKETPVTLLHLANMTSALPDNLPARKPGDTDVNARHAVLSSYSREDFFRDLKESQVESEPGTSPGHSNVAAILLGYILEDIYGRPYPSLVAQYIEAPAGMTGSPTERAESLSMSGSLMPRMSDVRYAIAAGGLEYSAQDLGHFMRYLINSSSESVHLLLQPTWKTLDGEAAITLGWIWRRSSPLGAYFQTSGGTYAFASYASIYRDCRVGIIVLQNGAGDETQGHLGALADGFASTMADAGVCAATN